MGCASSKNKNNGVADPKAPSASDADPSTLLVADPPKVEGKEEPVPIVEETACKNCGNNGKDILGKRCSCSFGQAIEGPLVPLKVTIVSGRSLRNADWIGKSDPYCTFEVSGKPDSVFKTKYVLNDLNPEWNHEADVGSYCVGNSLTFKVKDSDVAKADDSLGEVTLTTEQFWENGFDGEVQLSGAGNGGESFLKVRIEVLHPRVTVTIVSARGLRNADWIGKSDPYCICEIPGRKESRFQTKSITDELNPAWNHEAEVLKYHVEDAIDFTIKDTDPLKPDDMLGKVTLTNDQIVPGEFLWELPLLNAGAGCEAFLTINVIVGEKPEEKCADPEQEAVSMQQMEEETPSRPVTDVRVETNSAPTGLCC